MPKPSIDMSQPLQAAIQFNGVNRVFLNGPAREVIQHAGYSTVGLYTDPVILRSADPEAIVSQVLQSGSGTFFGIWGWSVTFTLPQYTQELAA